MRSTSQLLHAAFATFLAVSLSAQTYTVNQAKEILSKNDGLPCSPQRGANDSYYGSGCCGSPGNRSCFTGCTDPDANGLRWNKYDNKLLCNLPEPFAELPASAFLPSAKPAQRDFRFFVTSDLHFYRVNFDFNAQVSHPSRMNLMHVTSALAGKPYSAVIIPGDISTGPNEQRKAAFRLLYERYWLPGAGIFLPVFFGLGNHDASAQENYFGAEEKDAKRFWEYLDTRMSLQNIDTSINGCLVGIDYLCLGFGPMAGSHNYSWDWQGVHMVMLNTWAGDSDRSYPPPFGSNGLEWLRRDLAHFVGNSGRPVILFQHYPLSTASPYREYFTAANRDAFLSAIRTYNVVGLFTGHTHYLGMEARGGAINQPAGASVSGAGTVLDTFIDGAAGECGSENCSDATSNFLSVAVSEKYLDVTAHSWKGTSPTYIDGDMGMGPLGTSGSCRKRMATDYLDVTSSFDVDLQSSSNKLTLTNKTGSPLTGEFAVRFLNSGQNDVLTFWDFLDSCHPTHARRYKEVPAESIASGGSVSLTYNSSSTATSVRVYRIGDSLVTNNDAPVVGETAVDLQISAASGGSLPFTYQLDPYPSGDPTQWLGISVDQSTTPATFRLKANTGLAKYEHLTASFTVTPADTSVRPITIKVTLAPAAITVLSNVPNSRFLFDGNDTTLPYSQVVTPNSQHKIDVQTPQDALAGIRYTFKGWSNQGPKLQNFTVPFGGTTLTALFDTLYSVKATPTPTAAGTVNITGMGGPLFFSPGNITFQASPNSGYYFTGYTGDLTGSSASTTINLISPMDVKVNFAPNPTLNLSTNVPAIQGSTLTVNSVASPVPTNLAFAPGTVVNLAVPSSFTAASSASTRYVFQQWSDGVNTPVRAFTVGTSNASLSATYEKQFLIDVSALPAGTGSVTGGGWYLIGSPVSVQATPVAGFKLSQFTGTQTSTANPFGFPASQPNSLVANFVSDGLPQLFTLPAGTATDVNGGSEPLRSLPLIVRNSGLGGAINAQIDSITAIQTLGGSGAVLPQISSPIPVGILPAGAQAVTAVKFIWPTTATRVRMTINFSANGGTYKGSTVLNLFR